MPNTSAAPQAPLSSSPPSLLAAAIRALLAFAEAHNAKGLDDAGKDELRKLEAMALAHGKAAGIELRPVSLPLGPSDLPTLTGMHLARNRPGWPGRDVLTAHKFWLAAVKDWLAQAESAEAVKAPLRFTHDAATPPRVLLRTDLPAIIDAIRDLRIALENPRQWTTANRPTLPPGHPLTLQDVLMDDYFVFQEAVEHCRQRLRGMLAPNGEGDERGNCPAIADSQLDLKDKASLKRLLRLLMAKGPFDLWREREETLTWLSRLQADLNSGSADGSFQANGPNGTPTGTVGRTHNLSYPNERCRQVLNWLQAKFRELEMNHQLVSISTEEGTRQPLPDEGRFAAIPPSAFHDFLLSIGADVEPTIRECTGKGWLETWGRQSPRGQVERFYIVRPRILDARFPANEADGAGQDVRLAAAKQGEGGKPGAGPLKGIRRAEAEVRVREWLAAHAKDNWAAITRDAVVNGTGVSAGQVSKTAAWIAFRERRDALAKPVARNVPLTDAMQAVVPRDCDTPDELAALIEEQRAEEAEENRRHTRRHAPS